MPELIVSTLSTLQGNADIAIGNVLGSNVANILLILGVAAIFYPLPIKDNTMLSEIPFSLAAALLLGFLANAALLVDKPKLMLSRIDGMVLLFFFFLFMLYIYRLVLQGASEEDVSGAEKPLSLPQSILFVLGGVVAKSGKKLSGSGK